MIQLNDFCQCSDKWNHAAHCPSYKIRFLLAERYRLLAVRVREYADEAHQQTQDAGDFWRHHAGRRRAADEIAGWIEHQADEVERAS